MNHRKYKDMLYPVRPIADLKDLVDSSAALYADKPAYYVKDEPGGVYRPVSYRTAKAEIDALGTAFIDLGWQGKKIAVIGENSYEWVLSYCAVTNGTGVCVPLDRELRAPEIHHLLERAQVSAVIYAKKSEPLIQEAVRGVASVERLICMSELSEIIQRGKALIAAGDERFIRATIDREALCAVLFTSGTTGFAKGVMLSHKNIADNVLNISRYVKIKENGIGLSVLPMHHSYEMTCHIFTAMYQGCAVAICEGLKQIAKNMAEIQATVMLGVPLLFESMHKKIWKQAEASGKADKMRRAIAVSKKLKLYNRPKLIKRVFKDIHSVTGGCIENFIVGGAGINPKVIEDFEAMGFPMMQGYGMTECAPLIAVNRDRYSKADSVGSALPGTEVRIANPDKAGMGEILCRGPSVMLGYYSNPKETAKTLADGWLHTGDLGYFDEEGLLYIAGRVKDVIVTKNGKNIFPEEVEYYLTEEPYILEALVHGVPDEKSGDVVVNAGLYPDYDLIQEELGDITEEEIKQLMDEAVDRVNALMPLFKRVKRFTIRKREFSKTTTRKIKRRAAENFCEAAGQEEERVK